MQSLVPFRDDVSSLYGCPSHMSPEQHIEYAARWKAPWEHVLGNVWADFFANKGSAVHALPNVLVKSS
eukprot:5173062-Pyramimonas_sp.AAC.1